MFKNTVGAYFRKTLMLFNILFYISDQSLILWLVLLYSSVICTWNLFPRHDSFVYQSNVNMCLIKQQLYSERDQTLGANLTIIDLGPSYYLT